MSRWTSIGVAALLIAVGGLWASAQVQPGPRPAPNTQPPAQVISGADFGFRVDPRLSFFQMPVDDYHSPV